MNKLRNFIHDNFPILILCVVVLGSLAGVLSYSLGPIYSGYAQIILK